MGIVHVPFAISREFYLMALVTNFVRTESKSIVPSVKKCTYPRHLID